MLMKSLRGKRAMEHEQIGKFQILGTLGQGANSTILHIRRSADSKQYALKVVPLTSKDDLKYLEQAKHEFRVAGLLDHPSLIKIYALETPRDLLFRIRKVHLLTEYVNGETLDKAKGLTLPRLVQIFERVASAMVHMHRRNVFHADLKPNNIMLSRTADVKVLDYGLAWIKGEPKQRVQGTPEYMAPEQARHGMVNERSDIYNFGATMYRLVTWHLPPCCQGVIEGMPMDGKTFKSMLKRVQDYTPDAPPALCELIHRCLSWKAQERPERMSEIQGTLDHLADDLVTSPDDRLDAMEW
jgi:serine/threonine protein kinase